MATQLGALKRIKGFAGFNVDGFAYQSPDVAAYFLTHFHAVGLSDSPRFNSYSTTNRVTHVGISIHPDNEHKLCGVSSFRVRVVTLKNPLPV